MRLLADINIYEIDRKDGYNKLFSIKRQNAVEGIKEAIKYINIKYNENLIKGVKNMLSNIKSNVKK